MAQPSWPCARAGRPCHRARNLRGTTTSQQRALQFEFSKTVQRPRRSRRFHAKAQNTRRGKGNIRTFAVAFFAPLRTLRLGVKPCFVCGAGECGFQELRRLRPSASQECSAPLGAGCPRPGPAACGGLSSSQAAVVAGVHAKRSLVRTKSSRPTEWFSGVAARSILRMSRRRCRGRRPSG